MKKIATIAWILWFLFVLFIFWQEYADASMDPNTLEKLNACLADPNLIAVYFPTEPTPVINRQLLDPNSLDSEFAKMRWLDIQSKIPNWLQEPKSKIITFTYKAGSMIPEPNNLLLCPLLSKTWYDPNGIAYTTDAWILTKPKMINYKNL